ncbi:MAG: helix-turn-helix domain-containing protein, partial [Verrucomicrobiaceae bacterium]
MNVALMLPLFYEYARDLRRGVLDWVEANPGWRIIEIDPSAQPLTSRLAGHLHGAIVMGEVLSSSAAGFQLNGLPLVHCQYTGIPPEGLGDPSTVGFDHHTISRLAIDHFQDLGLEVAGFVGLKLREGAVRSIKVNPMREMARAAGMRWAEFDLYPVDPSEQPEWVWEGRNLHDLVAFIHNCPKPAGLLAQDDYVGTMLCEIAQGLGYRIPEEIAVLGQGNRVIGRTGHPSLSSIVIPGQEIGWTAAARLSLLLNGQQVNPRVMLLPCDKIILRTSTTGASHETGIERARRHFERHALGGVTVQELAVVAGCSVKTLRSRFLENYGMEIAKEVRERRKSAALGMLETTELDIGEIGRRCGFSSAPNFFNFVRRQT